MTLINYYEVPKKKRKVNQPDLPNKFFQTINIYTQSKLNF